MLATANIIDFVPVLSSFDSVLGIFIAAKRIFQELSQTRFNAEDPHLNECWNAVKNLFRRLVALVPLVGNVELLVFEANRNLVLISKIEQELQNKNDQFGIAIDGKILWINNSQQVKALFSRHSNAIADDTRENDLDVFEHLVNQILPKAKKAHGKNIKICNILESISNVLCYSAKA